MKNKKGPNGFTATFDGFVALDFRYAYLPFETMGSCPVRSQIIDKMGGGNYFSVWQNGVIRLIGHRFRVRLKDENWNLAGQSAQVNEVIGPLIENVKK